VRFAGDRRNAPAQVDHFVRAVRKLRTARSRRRLRPPGARGASRLDDVAARRPQVLVELELPVVPVKVRPATYSPTCGSTRSPRAIRTISSG
jgi:hypothetical protein